MTDKRTREPCGLHIHPKPVASCKYCDALLAELRAMPRYQPPGRPKPRNPGTFTYREPKKRAPK